MKNLYRVIIVAAAVAFSSCSAEDAIAEAHTNDTDKILEQRMKTIMAMDFTTLFTYCNAEEAQNQLPGAFSKVINNARHRLPIERGSTEAVMRVVVENGKGVLWSEHYMDVPNGRMVESINKKPDSHIMYVGSRDNYPALYRQVSETMKNSCKILGLNDDTATTAAVNDYLTSRLNNGNGIAEFHIKVTAASAEIYALK